MACSAYLPSANSYFIHSNHILPVSSTSIILTKQRTYLELEFFEAVEVVDVEALSHVESIAESFSKDSLRLLLVNHLPG